MCGHYVTFILTLAQGINKPELWGQAALLNFSHHMCWRTHRSAKITVSKSINLSLLRDFFYSPPTNHLLFKSHCQLQTWTSPHMSHSCRVLNFVWVHPWYNLLNCTQRSQTNRQTPKFIDPTLLSRDMMVCYTDPSCEQVFKSLVCASVHPTREL